MRQRCLETFLRVLCSLPWLTRRQQCHFSFSGGCQDDQGSDLRSLFSAAQATAEKEGTRLALLRLLLFSGPMDGAFCMVLGLLGVSPQHFMLGHTLASWRFSLEYACFGAMLTNGWGEQAELLVILRLVLALISGILVTSFAAPVSEQ
ncbi:unnamed protein product, partial [Effrenium voratum]